MAVTINIIHSCHLSLICATFYLGDANSKRYHCYEMSSKRLDRLLIEYVQKKGHLL